MRSIIDDESDDASDDTDENEESREKTNLFGVNYLMWFEVGIEGKDPIDQEEDDWGGKIEFGFKDKIFPKDLENYFILLNMSVPSHMLALAE